MVDSSLGLVKRWHFSALAFIWLFENHSINSLDEFSRASCTSLVFSPMTYGVLSLE